MNEGNIMREVVDNDNYFLHIQKSWKATIVAIKRD